MSADTKVNSDNIDVDLMINSYINQDMLVDTEIDTLITESNDPRNLDINSINPTTISTVRDTVQINYDRIENLSTMPIEILIKISQTMNFEDTKHASIAVGKYIPFNRSVNVFGNSRQLITDNVMDRTIKDYPIATTSIQMTAIDYRAVKMMKSLYPKLKYTTNKFSYDSNSKDIVDVDINHLHLIKSFKNINLLELISTSIELCNSKITYLKLNNSILTSIYLPKLLRLDLIKISDIDQIDNIFNSNAMDSLMSLTLAFNDDKLIDISKYISKFYNLSYISLTNIDIDKIENLHKLRILIISGFCKVIKNCSRLHQVSISPIKTRTDGSKTYLPQIYDCDIIHDVIINYACIYINLIKEYDDILEVFDLNRMLKYIEVRRLTFQLKIDLLDKYFNKNGADYYIRTSNLNSNNMPFGLSNEIKYYEYKEHMLIDISTEDGLINGIFMESKHIDLIRLLEMRDRYYYRV